ncbi:hypothetical protein AHAS_Ahas15G0233100 [Arachis hypogaea]
MREPRDPLPSREGGHARGSPQKSKFYRFDKEGNRWKERTDGTVKFPKNKGAITKRMTVIKEMAGMDVLCSDKTGTLTLNKLTVDKNLIETKRRYYFNYQPGDQLAIAKETGRRLGMGSNMYPSSSLLGESKDNFASVPVDDLIENADGFAKHKYEIVKRLQARKHICGMTGDGVNDAPALKIADIGIVVADATDAARSASDIVLTEPGLSVIISAVLTSREIFQRVKNYTIYVVSITIRIVVGFMLLTCIWEFNFPPFMVLVIAILNDEYETMKLSNPYNLH